jgi:hypothetical protein
MPKTAAAIQLAGRDEQTLRRWVRSSSIRAGFAQRARIVLAAAEGLSNTQIAERVGCSRPTVIRWRGRYAAKGLAGLEDQPRSGRPRTVRRDRRAEIVAVTQQPPPSSWASPTGRPARSPASGGEPDDGRQGLGRA